MEYQLIGKIVGIKGLKGELKIKELSGFMLERLQPNTMVYVEINNQYQPFIVKGYDQKKKDSLLVFKGYEDINLVSFLNKKNIYAPKDQTLDLDEHVFHETQLIGLDVYQNNELKGKVIEIRNYPKDDYLVVQSNEKTHLIPFRDEFIKKMDELMIEVVDMEGLF